MGKGAYRSDSVAENIMFWTTDLGFDVDISEFIKSEEQRVIYGTTKCHYWYATVTFKDYSYVLETSHFNMNILADDIKNHLIDIKHPEFSYLVKDYNYLSSKCFEETFYKLGSTINRVKTLFNPTKNEYYLYYNLNKNYKCIGEFIYTHKGAPENYVPGDIFNYIQNLVKDKKILPSYEVNFGTSQESPIKNCERIIKKINNNSLSIGKVFFNILNETYSVQFKSTTRSKRFKTKDFKPDSNDIKSFLHINFPEYLI